MQNQTNNSTWKNEPYFWMVILIPLSAVVMGFIMLSLAIESDSGLVVDDYYKKGKEINLVLARDQAALKMGLSANIQFRSDQNLISAQLGSETNTILPEQITIGIYHATRPGLDQFFTLQNIGSATYTGQYNALAPGRWNIQLATPHWRLTGSVHSPGSTEITLQPSGL